MSLSGRQEISVRIIQKQKFISEGYSSRVATGYFSVTQRGYEWVSFSFER